MDLFWHRRKQAVERSTTHHNGGGSFLQDAYPAVVNTVLAYNGASNLEREDSREVARGFDPDVANGEDDPDGDGSSNLEEFLNGKSSF